MLSLIAHAAFTHHQLMQHTRTASSCSIHTPPAHAAFTHRQLKQHSHTASSCSIHAPPAHAALTHHQLMQHSHTASSFSIHTPPAHAALTHHQLMQHSHTASTQYSPFGVEPGLGGESWELPDSAPQLPPSNVLGALAAWRSSWGQSHQEFSQRTKSDLPREQVLT